MTDEEYKAKFNGWVIALALGLAFLFFAALFTGGRGEAQMPLLAGSTVKVVLKQGHGSAVYLGQGRFLTATHVISDEAEISILTDKGNTAPATVLWSNKEFDLALLKSDIGGIRSSPLACRAAIVGEDVHAVGNPLTFEFITTAGRVAGKPRPIDDWRTVVPVDATVGPGMSGGPVLDKAENIIGTTVGMPAFGMGARLFRTLLLMVPSTVACDLLARS